MNWETYKRLPLHLQNEYDFRFKDRFYFHINWQLGLSMIASIAAWMIAVIYLSDKAQMTQNDLLTTIKSQFFILKAIIIFLMIDVVCKIIRMIILIQQYGKWKKENNIKDVFDWKELI
jgi:hypothetical protein